MFPSGTSERIEMNSSGTWSKKNIRQQKEKDREKATGEWKGERENRYGRKSYI